jgi:hypothetical protein
MDKGTKVGIQGSVTEGNILEESGEVHLSHPVLQVGLEERPRVKHLNFCS